MRLSPVLSVSGASLKVHASSTASGGSIHPSLYFCSPDSITHFTQDHSLLISWAQISDSEPVSKRKMTEDFHEIPLSACHVPSMGHVAHRECGIRQKITCSRISCILVAVGGRRVVVEADSSLKKSQIVINAIKMWNRTRCLRWLLVCVCMCVCARACTHICPGNPILKKWYFCCSQQQNNNSE